jgi:hypothetical protein
MKKFTFCFLALASALMATVAQAGSVYFTGDVGQRPLGQTSGVINVVIDLDTGDTLSAGGGIDFAIEATTPDIIQFTTAAITDGATVWDVRNAAVQNGQRVQLNTTALFAAGLPDGAQGKVLATINYNVLNAAGATGLSFVLPAVAGIVDGNHAVDADRTADYDFEANTVTFVPEPATLAMVGMSLIGLVVRRRNG